jgi:hypothetical protein
VTALPFAVYVAVVMPVVMRLERQAR